MASNDVEASSSTYLRLKNERGHWHNEEYNAPIDGFNGDRHQAMTTLQKHLGVPGTSTVEIQRLMGSPTKVLEKPDLVLEHEFRRMNDNFEYPIGAHIWIYEWRGFHDYVYFLVSKDNKVIQSDWYYALE